MIRRPPRSTLDRSSAASDVYKRQTHPAPVIMVGFIKFIKRIAAFVLAPLVVAFCLQAYFSITGAVAWQDLTWMLVGLVGYFIAYIVIYGSNLRFIETLEHELNHAITAILTLRTIALFEVVGKAVSYTHLRAHETVLDLVCRLLLEKKKKIQ